MPVSEQMGVLDLRQSQWIEAILVARAATSFMVFASCRRCLRSVSAMRHSTSMRAARMFEILTSRSEGMCLSSPIPQLLERKHTKTISALIHVKELAFGRCRLPQPQRAMLSARAAWWSSPCSREIASISTHDSSAGRHIQNHRRRVAVDLIRPTRIGSFRVPSPELPSRCRSRISAPQLFSASGLQRGGISKHLSILAAPRLIALAYLGDHRPPE